MNDRRTESRPGLKTGRYLYEICEGYCSRCSLAASEYNIALKHAIDSEEHQHAKRQYSTCD